MGDSDHREYYDCETYTEELIKVAQKNQLGAETVIVAHSFGGVLAIKAVAASLSDSRVLFCLILEWKHPTIYGTQIRLV